MTPASTTRRSARRPAQRGAATLVVVGLLFFVMSLVAAYTNRNLIFEQRTSANQYRSTQAFEAAEAGLEWASAMLNAGRLDAACTPSTVVTDTSFRERYLTIDPATGVVDPAGVLTADFAGTVWPSCVFDGADWSCSCPDPGAAPVVAAPAVPGILPAFRLRFVRASDTQPGVVRVEVNGCTRLDDACLNFPAQAVGGEGRATVSALLALRGGVAAPPLAAVTARGAVGGTLAAFNSDVRAAGLAVLAGGAVAGSVVTGTAPGSPASTAVRDADPGLVTMLPVDDAVRASRFFANTFATLPDVWKEQPGAVRHQAGAAVPVCAADPCTAGEIRSAVAANPGRVVWVDGGVDFDSGSAIGSAAAPLVLVATGNIRVAIDVTGLLYSRAPTWTLAGAGRVTGAIVAEGDLNGTGSVVVVRDDEVLQRARRLTGSFVRAPGGWKDF